MRAMSKAERAQCAVVNAVRSLISRIALPNRWTGLGRARGRRRLEIIAPPAPGGVPCFRCTEGPCSGEPLEGTPPGPAPHESIAARR